MMIAEIEKLKKEIIQQTCDVVDCMKAELDKCNIGGELYQANMVLDEVKKAHDFMLNKVGAITTNVDRIISNEPGNKDHMFDAYCQIDDWDNQNNNTEKFKSTRSKTNRKEC